MAPTQLSVEVSVEALKSFWRRRAWRQGVAVAVWGAIALGGAAPALGQSTAVTQTALQLAVCLNDWDSAIPLARRLEQTAGLPAKTQAQLVLFRRQMEVWRQEQTAVSNSSGCGPVLAGFGIPGYSGRPLALDRALANAGLEQPLGIPDLALRDEEALWQAGLGVSAATPLPPLALAQRINTRTGSGVSTGAVSRRVDVYTFVAAAGDRATFHLAVTQQRPGLLFTDNQALMSVFDTEGRLLAESRTSAAAPPQLEDLFLPSTGAYYVAVTTPQHRPVLDEAGFLVGWEGIGTSAITYTLTISGLTPSPQVGLGRR